MSQIRDVDFASEAANTYHNEGDPPNTHGSRGHFTISPKYPGISKSIGNFIELGKRCDTQQYQIGDEHNCRNKANAEILNHLRIHSQYRIIVKG